EIDKMGMDHRGDPASALLEVLDLSKTVHLTITIWKLITIFLKLCLFVLQIV
ncbi:hypothetical protein RED65_16676 [Oceanobacter sp. RED65]|nr:hypothetical protein RED65_16676 [Oceanobacter sp. RED65] [Bermanella marisrubri]